MTDIDYDNFIRNALQEPSDCRERGLEDICTVSPLVAQTQVPAAVDYRPDMLPVRNQGWQGSCVAMAAAAMKEWQESEHQVYFSPQFFYNNRMNLYDTDTSNDSGMYGSDMLKLLTNIGICFESTYPYGKIETKDKIPTAVYDEAKEFVIKSSARVIRSEDLKTSLHLYGPAVVFVPTYNSGARMWFKREADSYRGGHAMCVVGYTTDNHFIIRNSWGEQWNGDGHTLMSFSDFDTYTWGAYTTVDLIIEKKKTPILGYYVVYPDRKQIRAIAYLDHHIAGLSPYYRDNIHPSGAQCVIKEGIMTFTVKYDKIPESRADAPFTQSIQRLIDRYSFCHYVHKAEYMAMDNHIELEIQIGLHPDIIPITGNEQMTTPVEVQFLTWSNSTSVKFLFQSQ